MKLFTSFDGRISRKPFWLGSIAVVIVMIVISIPFGLLQATAGNPGAGLNVTMLVISILFLYPLMAISVKRLHDRNKPAMPWIVIYFLPGFVSNIMQTFQINYTMVNIGDISMPAPGPIAMGVVFIAIAISLWALVDLGFLKGTQGDNDYGPDPLA